MTTHRLFALLLLSLAPSLFAADPPRTIDVPMHSVDGEGKPVEERFAVPLRTTGCDGRFELVSLSTSMKLDQQPQKEGVVLVLFLHADATLKKLARGPAAPPELIVETADAKVSLPFEHAMAAPNWEEAGALLDERFTDSHLPLSSGWKSVELRCSQGSPWRSPVIPSGVTYVRKADDAVAAAVTKIGAALASPAGFGTPSLYDQMVILGPDLYKHLQAEPELATFQSPKMITIDPASKVSRSMLRAKGEKELALLQTVLSRYLGAAPRRLRPATSEELSAHWLNIGWDIDEPLIVVDNGAHRLVLDTADGGAHVMMIDELP